MNTQVRSEAVKGISRRFVFLFIASPQQGEPRVLDPPSGQGAGGGARTSDIRVSADHRADSLATLPQTPWNQSSSTPLVSFPDVFS
ncbi:hypothetical protein PoB_005833200 [Plakobranchus ocellatus]|uniref:Uncharacterized protein n=1 Tax=Plakobranchus ocellatus TaxID=259542 RepID=A0AAV4CJG6_9GAST|nr:hypothetical protein PoB_005833200 [Plakobranchus ocellatus]